MQCGSTHTTLDSVLYMRYSNGKMVTVVVRRCVIRRTRAHGAPTHTQEFTFFGQVNGRLGRVTRNDMQHSMVVVEDTTSGSVVGFLEIGMLPRPTSSEENALSLGTTAAGTTTTEEASEKDEDASTPAAAYTGSDVDGVVEDSRDEGDAGVTAIRRAPDVAYLANVVVDRNQRRRGIGRTMVNASIQIVRELWPGEDRIYVTVEKARGD